jgi:hypothetical protein
MQRPLTLEQIRERLQQRVNPPVSDLPSYEHPDLGMLYIGPLPSKGYSAVEAAEMWQPEWADWTKAEIKQFQDYNRDKAYILWGTWTADEKRLDEAMVCQILDQSSGQENRKLVNAIRAYNPPRENLADEIGVALGVCATDRILFRILERGGFYEFLRDFFLSRGGTPEHQALVADLDKWREAQPAFEVLLNAEVVAEDLDIGVYGRMAKDA